MPGNWSIEVTGPETINRNVAALRRVAPLALKQANEITGEEMVRDAQRFLKEHDAIVTGDLFNSIQWRVSSDGLEVEIGSTSRYAPYVEFGTSPHFPPLDAIRAWCRLRGIDESAAYPIAKKISEVGTPEQPFLYPAYQAQRRRHLERVRIILAAFLKGQL